MKATFRMCAPCLFGIEGLLADELKQMGALDVQSQNGRVLFSGGTDLLAKANIGSRFAERIQILLGSFHATSFEQLFQGVSALPLEQWIGKKDAFPVKGWSLNSQLFSIPDCQSIIKKAAVERLKSKYHIAWFEETGPLHQIQFSILKDTVSVMLDTSGEGLHKRGYRPVSNEAPLKETLAAAMVKLAHVRKNDTVIDPLCGSGTLLIEAALYAMHIAPGLKRRFAAEQWDCIGSKAFAYEREDAIDNIARDSAFEAVGFDIDEHAVELTMANAKRAGVSECFTVKQQDIRDFKCRWNQGIVLCNPPYGERMLEVSDAEAIYAQMGRAFKRQPGMRYYIISPHEDFEALYGGKADKRRKLYNGMLKCQFYMYFK